MIWLSMLIATAEPDPQTTLSALLNACQESMHLGGVLQPVEGRLAWSDFYGERSACVDQVLTVFAYPHVPEEHVLVLRVTRQSDVRQVDVKVLPKVSLHYFYESPGLSLEQKLELYLYLGVFHD